MTSLQRLCQRVGLRPIQPPPYIPAHKKRGRPTELERKQRIELHAALMREMYRKASRERYGTVEEMEREVYGC